MKQQKLKLEMWVDKIKTKNLKEKLLLQKNSSEIADDKKENEEKEEIEMNLSTQSKCNRLNCRI